MYKKGFTIIEAVIVVAIFLVLFTALMNLWVQSERTWQIGRDEQELQQEARKGVDRITEDLRESNLKWQTEAGNFCLSINSAGDRIDFYSPTFNATGNITSLTAVRYYVGGTDNKQLLRRTGTTDRVIALNINNVASQKPFFNFTSSLYAGSPCSCTSGMAGCCSDTNCAINIKIPVIKNPYTFSLNSTVALRNREESLGSIEILEVEEQQ